MTERDEPSVGALGDEAVKLLQALQDWARETAGTADSPGTGGLLSDLNEHIATGGKDCRYCPLCQLIGAVRATSPEVRHHLGVAASSLLQAAAGVLATPSSGQRNESGPVERIDLGGEDWEDD